VIVPKLTEAFGFE